MHYQISKYLKLAEDRYQNRTEQKKTKKPFPSPVDNYQHMNDSEYTEATTISTTTQRYSSWNSKNNKLQTNTIESDEYTNHLKFTSVRKHKPNYESRFTIDTSSSVFITRRRNTIDISGASEELITQIHGNVDLLPIDVTITLDEYHNLL